MNAPDHRPRVAAERRERMRARLLDSALELVAKKGPAATSIDDVISAAQVSRGTFYKYFDTPDALVREVAVELTNELMCLAETLVQLRDDPAERIATGMRIVITLACDYPAVGGFLLRLGWPDLDHRHLLFDFVRRDIDAAMKLRRFTPMPAVLALNIVSGTVLGAIHAAQGGAGRQIAETATASALRALGIDAKQAGTIVAADLRLPDIVEGGLVARTVAAGR